MEYQPPKLFQLEPRNVVAFQWLPFSEGFSYPKWFSTMIETGRALTVLNKEDAFIKLWNKRGEYKGLPGDWICRDEYGHIYVVSEKTFLFRYKDLNEIDGGSNDESA